MEDWLYFFKIFSYDLPDRLLEALPLLISCSTLITIYICFKNNFFNLTRFAGLSSKPYIRILGTQIILLIALSTGAREFFTIPLQDKAYEKSAHTTKNSHGHLFLRKDAQTLIIRGVNNLHGHLYLDQPYLISNSYPRYLVRAKTALIIKDQIQFIGAETFDFERQEIVSKARLKVQWPRLKEQLKTKAFALPTLDLLKARKSTNIRQVLGEKYLNAMVIQRLQVIIFALSFLVLMYISFAHFIDKVYSVEAISFKLGSLILLCWLLAIPISIFLI